MRPRPIHRTSAAIVAVLGVVALLSATLVFAASKPRIWLDRPLPGSILLYGPTTVTVHAASPSGIAVVRFSVDGSPAGEVGAPGGELVTVEWTWTPDSPGSHVVTAFARGVDGVFSDPVAATVTFVGRDELPPSAPPAPSTAPLPTPTFVATPGPTLPPGATPTPTPSPGATPTPTPSPVPTRTQPPSPPPSEPASSVPPDPTPTQTPIASFCNLPSPHLIAPAPDEVFTTIPEGTTALFEWTWTGPDCLAGFQLVIQLDQQIPDYAGYAPSYEFVVDLAPDTFVYEPPIMFLPDLGDAGSGHCGFYHWHVAAVDADGAQEYAEVNSFKVCNADG